MSMNEEQKITKEEKEYLRLLELGKERFRNEQYCPAYDCLTSISPNLDDAEAEHMLGILYTMNLRNRRLPTRAIKWWESSASKGNCDSHFLLGKMFRYGDRDGISIDHDKSRDHFRVAARAGHAESQNYLADAYYYGIGIDCDYTYAFKWHKKGALGGIVGSQYSVGYMYHHGQGVKQDNKSAFKWYIEAAKQDCSDSMCALGYMFYYGDGIEQDYDRAKEWFYRAIEHKNGDGYYYLAEMFSHGHGVKKDLDHAKDLYLNAGKNGNVKTQVRFGVERYRSKDYKSSYSWFKSALSGSDNITAHYYMGLLSSTSSGYSLDVHKAIEHFEIAGNEGHLDSCYQLGCLYFMTVAKT